MRTLKVLCCLLLGLSLGCEKTPRMDLKQGDCVLGEGMNVWQLVQIDHQGQHLFATTPVQEGSPVQIISDLSTLKKVECPQ